MTLNRKGVLDTMSRVQRHYHYTSLYTALIVTILLLLQLVSLFKGR